MNELMNDGGDCRTAPATPGLLENTGSLSPFLAHAAASWNHKNNVGFWSSSPVCERSFLWAGSGSEIDNWLLTLPTCHQESEN